MNPTADLRSVGQSLWLDNITRDLLTSGTLRDYIEGYSVTGLTSNPTIYDRAIAASDSYDLQIREIAHLGRPAEEVFFDLALMDLGAAADAFLPIHVRTAGVDGWVSLEVSPLLADDAGATIREARLLHSKAGRSNLFIKIPGTPAGLCAIEEVVYAGVPVNVTLLFSPAQYLAAAEAYTRAIERRIDAGLEPCVASVASVFVSRWDAAVADAVPEELGGQLGVAVARRTYASYRHLLESARWQRLLNEGARPQRLLWASTGSKSPRLSDVYYVEALAAAHTINTMPEETLRAFADHGRVGPVMAAEEDPSDATVATFVGAGVDPDLLADRLQRLGAEAFARSWASLLARIERKAALLAGRR